MYYVEIQTLTIEDALVMLMLSPGRLSVSAGKFVIVREKLKPHWGIHTSCFILIRSDVGSVGLLRHLEDEGGLVALHMRLVGAAGLRLRVLSDG